MKKRIFGLLLILTLVLTACPPPPPTSTNGVWDSSNWDSTAVWQ